MPMATDFAETRAWEVLRRCWSLRPHRALHTHLDSGYMTDSRMLAAKMLDVQFWSSFEWLRAFYSL